MHEWVNDMSYDVDKWSVHILYYSTVSHHSITLQNSLAVAVVVAVAIAIAVAATTGSIKNDHVFKSSCSSST